MSDMNNTFAAYNMNGVKHNIYRGEKVLQDAANEYKQRGDSIKEQINEIIEKKIRDEGSEFTNQH